MIKHMYLSIKSIIEILLLMNYCIDTTHCLHLCIKEIDTNIIYTNKNKTGTSGPFVEKETFNLTINRDIGFAVELAQS